MTSPLTVDGTKGFEYWCSWAFVGDTQLETRFWVFMSRSYVRAGCSTLCKMKNRPTASPEQMSPFGPAFVIPCWMTEKGMMEIQMRTLSLFYASLAPFSIPLPRTMTFLATDNHWNYVGFANGPRSRVKSWLGRAWSKFANL